MLVCLRFCLCPPPRNLDGSVGSGAPLTGFRISEFDPPAELLESEVKRQALTETIQRFLVTNESNQAPLDVKLASRSCGCIRMALDNQPLSINQAFVLNAGQSRQISLTVPVLSPGVHDAKNAKLCLSRRGESVAERVLYAQALVYRDLSVNPKRIELMIGSEGKVSRATVRIDWIHVIGDDSQSPETVISKSCEGIVSATIESAGATELIGTRLQRDHLQMQVHVPVGTSLTALLDLSGIEVKLRNSPVSEHVAVQIVDWRSLFAAKEISFGSVRAGSVSRRALIVRAVDSLPIGSIRTLNSGTGLINCQAEKELGGGRLLVTAALHAETPGTIDGQLTLTPTDGRHAPITVQYEAKVIP